MKDTDSSQAGDAAKGFIFPCQVEITVIGESGIDLKHLVSQRLEDLGVRVRHETMRYRSSREGHFISMTFSFDCDTRQQYTEAHAALRAAPGIRFTL